MMINKDRVNILLVDDQPANLLVMQTVLGSLDENLICVSSGEEALRAVLQTDFAVILLDVRMPTLSGFDTARLIRSRSKSSHVAILFITASIDAGFPIEEAYALGAVDYLAKPILPTVLRAKVAFFVELHRKTEELAKIERIRHAAALSEKDERIRLDEQRFSLLINSAGEGIFGVGLDASCTFMNSAGAAMLGYLPDELVGEAIHEIIHHHHADGSSYSENDCQIVSAARDGIAIRVEDEIFWRKDNSPVPVSYSVSPMLVDGKIEGAVITFTDITERKRAEDALRRVAAELSEADRRKTEFLATLAHELRNPLAPLRNGLHVIRLAADDPAAVARAREIMERQLCLMVHLVNDLLDVARITHGNVDLKKEETTLASIVNSAVETSMPLIEAGQHTLNISLPATQISLLVDPIRIAQVISNLLNNAAKYTPPGGKIALFALCHDEEVIISIEDNGRGIPAESLSTIFEMFTQLKKSNDGAQGGLGIGLSLVQFLVSLHGGTVAASSDGPGKGSLFSVRLPLHTSVAAPSGMAVVGSDDKAVAPLRILIVDDNVDATDTLAAMLNILGHATCVANDGYQALRVVQEFRPDVAFLDIGMPGMSGLDIARAFRNMAGMEHLMLVALTGWGTEEDRRRSMKAGFDRHLTKPIGLSDVNALFSTLVEDRNLANLPRD